MYLHKTAIAKQSDSFTHNKRIACNSHHFSLFVLSYFVNNLFSTSALLKKHSLVALLPVVYCQQRDPNHAVAQNLLARAQLCNSLAARLLAQSEPLASQVEWAQASLGTFSDTRALLDTETSLSPAETPSWLFAFPRRAWLPSYPRT